MRRLPLAGLALLAACAGSQQRSRVVTPSAMTVLLDTARNRVGSATILDSKTGGLLVLKLAHIPPGEHGLHVHANPACDPPTFASAGPHLNPAGKQHGSRNPTGPHAGDLPNVTVDADSSVDTTITISMELARAIGTGATARALVVHAKPDDLKTDPSGNSGDRIACGVLRR